MASNILEVFVDEKCTKRVVPLSSAGYQRILGRVVLDVLDDDTVGFHLGWKTKPERVIEREERRNGSDGVSHIYLEEWLFLAIDDWRKYVRVSEDVNSLNRFRMTTLQDAKAGYGFSYFGFSNLRDMKVNYPENMGDFWVLSPSKRLYMLE